MFIIMRRFLLFYGLVCFISIKAAAQNLSVVVNYTTAPGLSDKSLIFYDINHKLNWNDFRGTADANTVAAALTDAGFGYGSSYSYSDGKGVLTVTVYCDFNKDDSWVKPVGKNDYILKHEQHHFDIAYICTMQFIDKLRKTTYTTSNYNQLIGAAYKEFATTMNAMQNQYDDETQHGLLKDKQEEWSNKIDKQMESFNAVEQ
jgi:hypothetical protein